jgi:hypothetical protein
VDPGITTIAVGDINLTPRGERGVGTPVERRAAHEGRRLAGNAELEQDFAVQGDLANEMAAIVRELANEMAAIVREEHRIRRSLSRNLIIGC